MFKKNTRKSITLLAPAVLSLALVACSPSHSDADPQSADNTHDDHDAHSSEVRSAESHIHGGAAMAIVSEKNRITIEFESPLYNLLGFEYEPRSEAEKDLAEKVEAALSKPQNLISFNKDAKCSFLDSKPEVELFDHDDDHHEDEEDDEHHDDDHHEDHDDESSENHADVILNYELTCKAIDKLKTVRVEFFNEFSNFTELELIYLGPSKQLSAELTASRPTADLTK